MVAGMLMPLDNLRAIYERLFRDGVMVAKKDKRPQIKHPEIPEVGNLQVIRAMGSLKSRGFVRETFAWRHFYWYLTNEGIVYLRDYLHLPPEIVPTPLQRVRRPAATLSIVQKAARVQAVEGPTSYVPKPGKVGAESQENLLERQGYRHKRMQTENDAMPNEKTSRFRGRPITVDYSKSRPSGESRDQVQSMFQGGQGMDQSVKRKTTTISHQPPANFSSATSLEQKIPESYKKTSEASLITRAPKTMENVALPAKIAVTAEKAVLEASMPTSKAGKPKEEVSVKASPDLIITKTAKDISMTPNIKDHMEQTLKVTKINNTQEQQVKDKMLNNLETSISSKPSTPQSTELKPKAKALQETTISKTAKDSNVQSSSKGQMEKSLSVTKIKNIQEHIVKEEIPQNKEACQQLITSEAPKAVPLSSHSGTLVEKTLKVTKTQNVTEHLVEEKIYKNTETHISISSKSTDSQMEKLKSEMKVSQPAKNDSLIPSEKQVTAAEAKNDQEHPIKDEMAQNTKIDISTTTSSIDPVESKAKSKASQDLISSEPTKETLMPLPSKKQAGKTTKAKNIQSQPAKDEMTTNTEKSLVSSSTSVFQPVELKSKATEEVVTSKPPKDAAVPPPTKKQEGKKLKVIEAKSSPEHLVKNEISQNKETCISLAVQELESQTENKPDLAKREHTEEIKDKSDTGKALGSGVARVFKPNEDATVANDVVGFVQEKTDICLAQQTSETPLEEKNSNVDADTAVSPSAPMTVLSSNVPKRKKSQKTPGTKETKDTQIAFTHIKPIQVNAPKMEEIQSQESSTTDKMLQDDTDPVRGLSDAATIEQVKEVIIHEEMKVVTQTTQVKKKITKHELTSIQQTPPPPIKKMEESEAKDSKTKEADAAPKSSKRKKKKQTAADKQVPSSAAETNAAEEMVTAQAAVKILPSQGSEPFAKSESPKLCSDESSQSAAVESEAPLHKGEVEPAQPSGEKIKEEVLKGKTSSSQRLREAPTARASAAASAQAGPYPEHGDPPSVAQHSTAPDTHSSGEKQKVLCESKAIKQRVTGPLSAEEKQALSEEEAAMRKKIVVVEEVIEVQQQVASPSADGSQPVVPPVPEIPGDDLDYDVLEQLAKERAVFKSPVKEVTWDHSLDEPEKKIFPNFVEDERDRVQKKTFTKWVNKHLIKAQRHVTDLYEDLRDGHNLISLLEVLSGDTLPREKGRMRFHKLQNVQIALDFLKHRQVKLVNIRNDDIADGNPKLTLGLIWTIILHFQISDIQVNGQSDDMSAKEKLLLWSQRMVDGYQGLRCDNFTTSWRDGKLFNAVIHRHQPRLIDMGKVYRQTNLENLEQAFSVAEKELGVTRLLDPEDVDVSHPDEKSIITYVSSLYDAMPRALDATDGVRITELELRWKEYYELVTILLQWIRHHVVIFEERKFPASYEEIELLWRQFLMFKEAELPAKESDKDRSKLVYQTFESAVHAGQIKVPPGYHPIDVEKEWGRLHVAILERERLLRTEFDRLERLQRIVSKVQLDSGVCEEQLNQMESLLQSDIRLLNAGKPAQNTLEVDRGLDKADGLIRLLFNDVQILKDGRHLQAEQMYRRVYRLHERLVSLRSDYNLRLKAGATQTVSSQVHLSSQRGRPELDDVTLRYAQDLLAWVEENQRRIETAEWGSDLPTVESQLGSHRGLHQTVEDFKAKIERARNDESQLSPVSKSTYREYLAKLDIQYAKLLNSSKSRLRHLDQLQAFVSAATKELMWLNDKEEEEVKFDWSDRNTNMTAKKENYSGLMRELELRERKINDIQATGDRLIKDGHPGRKTVEAFTAALQTQWSWILQLCCCIEAHLKENTAYYQFFSDVKAADEKMKKMQDNMKKKYSCDRSTTATRLEDLLQDAQDEKEQLNELKTHVAGLNKRAKSIIQLKPRNPTTPIKGKLPIQAVCDFKQMEITVHKGEECALLNNSPPDRWKVLNQSGSDATVPSVCFIVPPVNKEAVESVSNLDMGLLQMTILWQRLHGDMKSLLSWQYLMRDIQLIRSWNITILKTMKVDEYRQILRNLDIHYQDFLRDTKNSQLFNPDECMQTEKDYKKTTQHYEELLRTMEKGDQDESVCKTYITQVRDLRLKIEDCESRTVARIRQPVEKDPLNDCLQKATDQKKVHMELDGIKKNLDKVAQKAEEVLASPEQSSTPVLRSELDITLQKMDHTHCLSSVYLEKLKTIELVIRNTQGAEDILKQYEDRLRKVYTVPADTVEVETYRTELKKMRNEAEGKQPVFDALEGELSKATAVSERMAQVHRERDVELDHYKQLLSNLRERWHAIFTQIDLRQRELEQLGRQLGYYRESYDWLIRWITDARQRQEKIQAIPITDSKTLKEQLGQEKKLLEEIEKNKEKCDECHKYAKDYIDTIKDYELQLVAYRAQVEPLTSPLKKTKMESASDNIIQEYVTLRTRYSELLTLTSQYIKFITDTMSRLEDEEKAAEKLKEEERKKIAEMQAELDKQKQLAEAHKKAIAKSEKEAQELKLMMEQEVRKREDVSVDAENQKHTIQQELTELRILSEQQIKLKSQLVDEAHQSRDKIEDELRIIRLQLETTLKQKSTAEAELKKLRDNAAEAERLRKAAQEDAEKFRKQVTEETQKKLKAEEELRLKSEAESEAAKQKQKALEALDQLRKQAEEAEKRMKLAEVEKEKQISVAQVASQQHVSYVEKTSILEETLKEKHGTVVQLQEEAERLKKQSDEADRAREGAEKELEKWRQKANEALRLRLQAEEEAHKKTLAQEEAEKQKEEAEREAKKRTKAEESALKQKEMAEQELERQRKLAECTAQQKLSAEQELIRLRSDFDHAEQQRSVLEDELYRLKNEVNAAMQQRKQLEDELAKVRSEMDILIQLKAKAEKESMSNIVERKELLEAEAAKMRELAEEAAKLRTIAEEAKRQRQVAEEEAARQRAEAERILKEKLAAINEATCLKTEAEIALKEKEAENERLRRKAEDEAYQRKAFEDQASQHKQDIEEKINQLKKSSDMELERQKAIVDDALKQRRVVEEEIRILKLNFEKASSGKLDLELELNKLKNIADETQQSKLRAEDEAEKFRKLALAEENKRREAEEKVKKIAAAEEEAARQRRIAQEEVERLKTRAEEAKRHKEEADKAAEKQIFAAEEAVQRCSAAEQQVQSVLLQQKKDNIVQEKLKEEYERAKKLAEEANKAREKAEKEAALLHQKALEAEVQRQAAEAEAASQAKAQEDAERLRKEAELEAAKLAQAEAAALKQKQQADAEMAKHKLLAEQTLKQKSQIEQELTKVKVQLDETDKQKSLLDEELHRLKDEVTDAVRQKAQVEDELFKVKIQMEELIKLKLRMEEENHRLMKKDKDNTQKFLAEEAENMKKLAEEAARLSIEAQEAARLRQIAESDLAQQRALAEKMLKEKLQAIQEASKLKAEAEMLQRQKDLAQEQAQKLLEDKQQMQQRLEEETKKLEVQHLSSIKEADELRRAITELEKEKEKLKKDAEDLQKKSKE
ncbi:microtubule-actin cross-linking factor 1-like, partial [Clarias magur]